MFQTEEKVKKLVWGVKASLIILAVIGFAFLISFLATREIWQIILTVLFWGIFGGFFFRGLHSIPEEQRWIVEVFGKYLDIYEPGLVWLCPGLMKMREAVSLWEQRYPLFEKPIKIDFVNGSATPKDAYAFVQVEGGRERLKAKSQDEAEQHEKTVKDSAYKVVYAIKNVKGASTALIENAVRSYLNSLSVEEGLMQGRAGYDLVGQMTVKADTTTLIDGVKAALKIWGLELRRVTVTDYDLDEAIIKAREEVIKAERDDVAAQSRAHQKALQSGGMHGEIKNMLVETYHCSPAEAEKLAQNYVELWKVTEEKALTKWQFQGEGGGLYSEIAKIVVAIEAAKKTAK